MQIITYPIPMLKERYLTLPVVEDLKKKMVFVGGPAKSGRRPWP